MNILIQDAEETQKIRLLQLNSEENNNTDLNSVTQIQQQHPQQHQQ